MKKCLLLLFWTLALLSDILAQATNREFGVVPIETFDMKIYEKDPEASAVVLFDIGVARFYDDDDGFYIYFRRTRRMRILKNDAIDHVSIVNIPYYRGDDGRSERVTKIQAYTYNEQNGVVTKVPLEPAQIFEETINENWRNKTFAFPRVKEGSVIEYEY